jgi:methylated-DNA-[protein]-cysteine S-methyltransferase
MGIVWRQAAGGPRVLQVFLGKEKKPVEWVIRDSYANARPCSSPEIDKIKDQMQRFLEGEDIVFDLSRVELESCGEFQRKVLLAEYSIPRGWVSTYGRIAAEIGSAGGGRAVGRALAENPFPILIPCHRVVRADGGIGGYQGGSGMKRALLAMEGVEFTDGHRMLMEKVYY